MNKSEKSPPKIFVTTVTNRGYKFLPNVINNFIRQTYPYKKLMIVFNCNNIQQDKVLDQLYANGITECEVKIIPDRSLGYCLNYSIHQIPGDFHIWSKMDDDDYYGENYLMTNLESMLRSNADIVGRRDMYIYVPDWNKLYFKKNGGNNIHVPWVQGATLFVKKHVFNKVVFPEKNKGEDTHFENEARQKGFKIFAAPYNDFMVIRRNNNRNHTWKINLKDYLKYGFVVNNKLFKGQNKHIF